MKLYCIQLRTVTCNVCTLSICPHIALMAVLWIPGIGYACAVIVFLLNCEYNIILTWAFHYLFSSFTTELPWSNCNNDWNTPACRKDHRTVTSSNDSTMAYNTSLTGNATGVPAPALANVTALLEAGSNVTMKIMDPVTEYWE